MQRKRKGFTLVELLVVIAIIGLLSTIAFISLNRARGKARDAKRISDIRQIQSALELYYNDFSPPSYPYGSGILSSAIIGSTYVAEVPVAPTPPDGSCGGDNSYFYQSWTTQAMSVGCPGAGQCGWYRIKFCLGSATGGMVEGCKYASPSGIIDNTGCAAP